MSETETLRVNFWSFVTTTRPGQRKVGRVLLRRNLTAVVSIDSTCCFALIFEHDWLRNHGQGQSIVITTRLILNGYKLSLL